MTDKHDKTTLTPTIGADILNEHDAALRLGVSRTTLRRKRMSGELAFFRFGRRVLYSFKDHLLPSLQKCEQNSETNQKQ